MNARKGVTLVTPDQQQVFAATAKIGQDGINHEWVHARSDTASHLHVGWDQATGYGFATLFDHGTHPIKEIPFTSSAAFVVGEYSTWTEGYNTNFAQFGVMTATDSVHWTQPALIQATQSASRPTVELPGSSGLIVYAPSATSTDTHWTFVAVPQSATTTSAGAGLIFIAWVQVIELMGREIQHSKRTRGLPPGEENIEPFEAEAIREWVYQQQGLSEGPITRQLHGRH